MTSLAPASPSLKDIKDYFGYSTLPAFSKDWKQLSDKDKEQIKKGLSDGTYNY